MLHVSFRHGQVRRRWLAALACACLLSVAAPAPGQSTIGDAQAETLALGGRHLEAAARYEQLARRGMFKLDAGFALLAAREYLAAGEPAEAARLAEKVRTRARGDEERTLLAIVDAGLALDQGQPQRALAALHAAPSPLPQIYEPDFLSLRGRAEFASGRALDGIRTFEQRSAALDTPQAHADNDRLLFDQLLLHPPQGTVPPPGSSERERGWLQLPALFAALGAAAQDPASSTAAQMQSWLAQHPGHPGAKYLPRSTTTPTTGGSSTGSSGTSDAVALLLPLTGRQHSAADAVRDGFIAAWFASASRDARVRVEMYDTAVQGAAAAYARALAGGAQVVVGPLLKEEIAAVVNAQPSGLPVPTLALNSGIAPGQAPPAFLYQFALDPEHEARAVARRIAEDGLTRGIALFPANSWGQRVHDAFVDELQRAGTVMLASPQFYAPGAKDFSGPLRAALGRFGGAGDRPANRTRPLPGRDPAAERAAGPQFAFIAATPQAARAIRPQLRFQMTYDLAVYSTSDAWEPSVRAAADLEGMTFPEMPWLLDAGQGAPELWDALQQDWSARVRGRMRLYAFGYDAFRLARQLAGGAPVIGLQGLTGTLEVDGGDGRVRRNLQFARIEGGRPLPAGAAGTLIPAEPVTNSAGDAPGP